MGIQIITQPQTLKNASTVMGAAAGLSAVSGLTVYGSVSASNSVFANTLSAIGTVYDSVGNSSQWGSVYSSVVSNSATWNSAALAGIDTGVRALSTGWQNTYTAFSTQSANNISVYSNVRSNSATWGGVVPVKTVSTMNGSAGTLVINGYTNTTAVNYMVYLDGVKQVADSDYSLSATSTGGQIVFVVTPPNGVVADVTAYQSPIAATPALSGIAPISNSFTGNGSTSSYAINGYTNTQAESYSVYVGGLYQRPGVDYTAAGGSIAFTTPPPNGTSIMILAYQTMPGNISYGSSVPGNFSIGGTITLGSVTITSGSGSPEGVVTAVVGSLYLNTAGSTSTTLYVKTSGSGNTGWTAK